MNKLDLTKQHRTYFTAKETPAIVDIEQAQFISINGKGDPSGEPFAKNIEALYSVAYAIKFLHKASGNDFVVSKLEGLWWFDEKKYAGKTITSASVKVPRSEWEYRLLIRMPDFVEQKDVETAKQAVLAKKGLPLAGQVEYFSMREGRSVQMLHVGPFATEPETLARMMRFMEEQKLLRNGLHHEIYLSDFRRTAPLKLKTILREPVK